VALGAAVGMGGKRVLPPAVGMIERVSGALEDQLGAPDDHEQADQGQNANNPCNDLHASLLGSG
jgi:hypothetical protein